MEALIWASFVAGYLAFARYVPRWIDATLQFLGRISYSLYLIHLIVIWIFAEKGWFFSIGSLSVNQNILLTTVVLFLPVVTAISALTYVSIEEPFLSMRRRYNPVKEESAAAAGQSVTISR